MREKKLTTQDMVLSCQSLQDQLKQELDTENRRINVDSAKKRAVVQRILIIKTQDMDYEGFRQMVLGANLYRIKSRELKDFSVATDRVMNPLQTTFNTIETSNTPTPQLQDLIKNMQTLRCSNFREFRAAFTQRYRKPIDDQVINDIDILLKSQTTENWRKIVSIDFQVSYFLDMLDIFELQLTEIDQVCFIVQLMHGKQSPQFQELSQFKDFQFQVPKFLKKSEKERIANFLQQLNSVDFSDSGITEEFYPILQKVNQYYSS